jgi:tRNA pseudouridine55 synthase
VFLLGRATRLSRYVTDLHKEYVATARFGATSTTLDAEGEITLLSDAAEPTEGGLRAATQRLTGNLEQIPPMASAVKVAGERLYKAHRRGEEVERRPRAITVHAFELVSLDPETASASFRISCGSGTYVRTLVADLAASLDTGAYLTALRRIRVGHLPIEDAITPDKLDPSNLQNCIIQLKETVAHLPAVAVSEEERRLVCNGRRLGKFGVQGSYRVEGGGELLAIYRDDGDVARAEVVLCAR